MRITRTKNFLINLGLLILTVTILLLVAELILRQKPDITSMVGIDVHSVIDASPENLIREKENTIIWHRNFSEVYPPIKDVNTFSIMLIGDSFTFGEGIKEEERFSNILETKLNSLKGSPKQFKILNLGTQGYNAQQINVLFKEYFPLLNPDLVIYCFFQNDYAVQEYVKKSRNRFEIIFGLSEMDYITEIPFNHVLLKNLRTWRFFNKKASNIMVKTGIIEKPKKFYLSEEEFKEKTKEMIQIANSKNIPFAIIDVSPLESGELQHLELNTPIFLETHEALKQKGDTSDFLLKNGHYNAEGHKIVADVILNFLIKENLIPQA